MDDIYFFKSFRFKQFLIHKYRHNNNLHGIGMHFIGYMLEGEGVLTSKELSIHVKAGDMFYIPKGCRYQSIWSSENNIRFYSLGFAYMPSSCSFRLQKICKTDEMMELLYKITAELKVTPFSVGALYSLFGLAALTMEKSVSDGSIVIDEAIAVMKRNPTLSMREVAFSCNVSESTLYNTFKAVLGKTPNRVRSEIQCQQVIELLETTDYPIEKIVHKTGFSSSSYMRKKLFEYTAKTPREIRKSGSGI